MAGFDRQDFKMTPIRAGVNLGQANKGQRGIHL